jgi:hypothetical protein
MAKNKTENEVVKSSSNAKGMTGEVECICNRCGAVMKVPTGKFYTKAVPARPAVPARSELKDKEGNVLREAVAAKPFFPGRSLRHFDITSGGCDGTLSTVNQKRPKLHKKSRDKAIKNKQK